MRGDLEEAYFFGAFSSVRRVSNGDSDSCAKLKSGYLTRGRLFIDRGFPVLR